MNLLQTAPFLILGLFLLATVACGDSKASEPTPIPTIRVIEPTNPLELRRPTPTPGPTATPVSDTSAVLIFRPTATPWPLSEIASYPTLPQRKTAAPHTTGDVPHRQLGVEPVPEINDKLFRLAFSLPELENRPTTVSLPGARGLWIAEDVRLRRPDAISSGREFTHIHPDGSLHLPLPPDRAMEAGAAGWGEQHPWASQGRVYGGLMLIYTPQTMEDLDTVVRLIVESYNFVTARNIEPLDVISGKLANAPISLPERERTQPVMTRGTEHHWLDVMPISTTNPAPEIYDELIRLAFSLPDVEKRPTIPSLPHEPHGLVIAEGIPIDVPNILSEANEFNIDREFAHIHLDGSIHLHLPSNRVKEVVGRGWGERHPWAGSTINTTELGWVRYSPLLSFVYSPTTMEELEIVVRLIVESYNFVTGRSVNPSDVINGRLAAAEQAAASIPLPQREGPQPHLRGISNHQEDVEAVPEIYHELFRLAFSLPEVEERPSNISPRGATGLWISESASLERPAAISEGREFAHIHPDASVHLPLPDDRTMQVSSAGWGERHIAAGQTIAGNHYSPWQAVLYTPRTTEELEVVAGLIVESYNFVTGRDIEPLDFISGQLAAEPAAIPVPLPQRESPQPQIGTGISGFHQQSVDPVPEIYDELFRLAFSLPEVEERPSNISPEGAAGLWISEGTVLERPEAISEGREFAHLHPDGSMHLPLRVDRTLEVRNAGWGEWHPWGGQTIGQVHYSPFLTLIYTPTTIEELEVVARLIVESYNFVTGRNVSTDDLK